MHRRQRSPALASGALMRGDYLPVLRKRLTQNFTAIPNALLQDHRLSCRDRGLLVWMLSKPPDWQFSKMAIKAELALDGECSIQSAVKALQKTGYLKITRERTEKGKLGNVVWNVYDTPQVDFPVMGNPSLENPALDNRANTKNRNNKRKNNKRTAPARGSGEQPSDLYFDTEAGEWRRRNA